MNVVCYNYSLTTVFDTLFKHSRICIIKNDTSSDQVLDNETWQKPRKKNNKKVHLLRKKEHSVSGLPAEETLTKCGPRDPVPFGVKELLVAEHHQAGYKVLYFLLGWFQNPEIHPSVLSEPHFTEKRLQGLSVSSIYQSFTIYGLGSC